MISVLKFFIRKMVGYLARAIRASEKQRATIYAESIVMIMYVAASWN